MISEHILWWTRSVRNIPVEGPKKYLQDTTGGKNWQLILGLKVKVDSGIPVLFQCVWSVLQVAVCNLASIALNMYVDTKKKVFDFAKFRDVVKVMVRNLNKIIEVNYYPVEEVSSERDVPLPAVNADGVAGFHTQ